MGIQLGAKYGLLTVIGRAGRGKNGALLWEVRCACGKILARTTHELQTARSCGCARNKTKSVAAVVVNADVIKDADRLRQLATNRIALDHYERDRAKVARLLLAHQDELGENGSVIISRFWWYRGEDSDTQAHLTNPARIPTNRTDLMLNEQIAPALYRLADRLDKANAKMIEQNSEVKSLIEEILIMLKQDQQSVHIDTTCKALLQEE